jgi:hypothetical protein
VTSPGQTTLLPGDPPIQQERSGHADTVPGPDRKRHLRAGLISFGIYLVCSLVVWLNVWSTHPTTVTTCGCGDTSLFTWFLAWPAYAISHGLNPLYSTALFHPTGVNLLSNTAEVGIGIVLAPVTWLFGPVATLNVALTLAPVLSGVAMFVLLSRWVDWAPAAFVGGLLYGFSPFILISLTDSHLMLGMSPVPPLIVLCLDEMLVRQTRRPVLIGAVLGVLVTVQFFIGTEMLVIVAMCAAAGVALVCLHGWLTNRAGLRVRVRYATVAILSAGAVGGALLAYPVWFALAGPAHLSDPIWPHSIIGIGGSNLHDYFLPIPASAYETGLAHRLGGYQAGVLSNQYLGFGLVAVVAAGMVIWRRDRRLWLFGAVGLMSVALSFGGEPTSWSPWRLFWHEPLLQNIIPSRFESITYLCVAVMLAVIVDHTYAAFGRHRQRLLAGSDALWSRPVELWPRLGALAAWSVAAIALIPIGAYFAPSIPFTTPPLVVPAWFRDVAPHLKGRQVVLAFPVPFAFLSSPMTWQAVEGMPFDMVGGSGPGSVPERAGQERAGQLYLGPTSLDLQRASVTPQDVRAVRQALDGWGVTMVVVPASLRVPLYEQVLTMRTTAVVMTAATGQAPRFQAGAWVWSRVNRAGPAVVPSSATLSRCDSGPEDGTRASIVRSDRCVLADSSALR